MSHDIDRRTLQAVRDSDPHRSGAAKRAVKLSCAIGLTAAVAGLVSLLPAGRAIAAAEAPLAGKATSTAGPGSAGSERGAPSAYGRLPVGFVPNTGQTDSRVRYSAQGAGFGFSFTAKEAVLAFVQEGRGMAIGLRFLGAQAEPEGARRLPGRVNYLIGSDRTTWRTGLHTYREVVYRDLWPGIDLAFRGERGTLKYEFRLAAGADVHDIRLAYRGADRLSLGRDGALGIHTPFGLLRDTRPVSYQEVDGRRSPVASRFVLGTGDAYRFAVGRYDPRRPLVIDPGLVYSTYLGGTGNDQGSGIAVDSAGSAYLTGFTASTNFPTTVGAFDPTFNGGANDAFVTKLNPAGSSLVYSTYVGGSGNDQGIGIALDAAGSAYLTGFTASTNFPTTSGAFDTTFNSGANDAFVTKLNAAGSALVYSTFLGGSGNDQGIGIALDGAASAYVTGITGSTNFPTTGGAFDASFNGVNDAFVAKLNAAGSALVYSTYLGGTSRDEGLGITVDPPGSAYVTGLSGGANFPTSAAAFDTSHSGRLDVFVTKLNPTGSALVYSTYLGGAFDEQGLGVVVDAVGGAYVTGLTSSTGFPTSSGAFDTSFNGLQDAFVTKLNTVGSALVYSTFLGGTSTDQALALAVDAAGKAHVTGLTSSANFPTTLGAFDRTLNNIDAFATKLDTAGSALVYSTYLGGSGDDRGFAIALDGVGNGYVTGRTASSDFPTTVGASDPSFNGVSDAFVTKLDFVGAPTALTLAPKAATNTVGTPHTLTAKVRDFAGIPVPGVIVRFSVSGANSASGSAVTDANGEATFTYTGTTAGLDAITAFADGDDDRTQDVGEPADTATKVWTPGAPAIVALTPPTGANTVDTQHCVTATVTDAFGNAVAGVSVIFSVPTAVATHASPSGRSAVTDANGQATFCFTASLPGADTVHAFADSDDDELQDAGEPFGAATKVWTLPPSTALCDVTITEGGSIIALNGDLATFSGRATVSANGLNVEGREQYRDHGPAQPRDVQSIMLTAVTCSDDLTTATIFGTATIDGSGTFVFRIDVSDQGEPGTNDSYGIILSDGYASGQQRLRGGNVQIHKS